MSEAEYTPLRGSVAFKVIEYLTENPGSRLNQSSISAKYECQYQMVHSLMGPAVKAGTVIRTEDPDTSEIAYELPKRRKAVESGAVLRPKASALPSVRAPALNLNSITINSNVPLPGARRVSDWVPLFDRMKVGDCCSGTRWGWVAVGRPAATTSSPRRTTATCRT